jgi:acetyl-CoA carboxylase biotin carboxylase subunit
MQAFGDRDLFIEKYLERVRHVEVQILADHFGNVIPLCTRDCSLQIRNKKIVEEGPAAFVSGEMRRSLEKTAVDIASMLGYVNAGTVEFLVDGDRYYFIEMNTRLQVEHPVTEAITGVDIVEAQIRIAEGERMQMRAGDIESQGHAIEFRINAQDPDNRFLPSTGTVTALTLPSGIGVRGGLRHRRGQPG